MVYSCDTLAPHGRSGTRGLCKLELSLLLRLNDVNRMMQRRFILLCIFSWPINTRPCWRLNWPIKLMNVKLKCNLIWQLHYKIYLIFQLSHFRTMFNARHFGFGLTSVTMFSPKPASVIQMIWWIFAIRVILLEIVILFRMTMFCLCHL